MDKDGILVNKCVPVDNNLESFLQLCNNKISDCRNGLQLLDVFGTVSVLNNEITKCHLIGINITDLLIEDEKEEDKE